ncbi:hypothetical protein, partial [Lacticaseibacillus suilingensis]|uniref:hypothetical protein n=1 Tax=Lacticaseibacillus suilingensis TaxID=2799577 RepID=UPI00194FE345
HQFRFDEAIILPGKGQSKPVCYWVLTVRLPYLTLILLLKIIKKLKNKALKNIQFLQDLI